MSLLQKRNQRRATFIGALLGAIIIITFVISLIAPGSNRRSTSSDVTYPTLTPYGTGLPPTPVIIPTVDPNPQLAGELPYMHSTGLYQTFRPAGNDWVISEGQGADGAVSVVIQSPARLAVIHNYIRPGVEYENAESLSTDFLTENHFVEAWSEYDSWAETGRTISDNKVFVNFDLSSEGNQYLGRAIAWVDGGWLYVSRMVVPANNPMLLDLLQKYVLSEFVGYPQLQVLPEFWPAYSDQELGFLLKHPNGWQVVAGSKGRQVTFDVPVDNGKTTVRVWATANMPIADETQAQTWLMETESTATVVAIEPAERVLGTGFQIAYTYRDTAGDPHSGLMVMLNDEHGTLFTANLQATPPDMNWLDAQTLSETDGETAQALISGFIVLPDIARTPTPAVQ
jgi:hypothetical protein